MTVQHSEIEYKKQFCLRILVHISLEKILPNQYLEPILIGAQCGT